MWAVVPYKGASNAKRRLASVLNQSERSALVLTMVRDVIQALKASKHIEDIVLMSKSPTAQQLAADFDLTLYREKSSTLVDALIEVSDWLVMTHKASSSFIVPGDIPLITRESVDVVISNHREVTIIPDRILVGTNGLITTPPNAFPYVFDGKSFSPHCAAARECGFLPNIDRIPEFELDIDTPEDLKELAIRAPDSNTGQFLKQTEYFSTSFARPNQHIAP